MTVEKENHEWKNGKCTECKYVCEHKGGTATCTERAKCEICGKQYGKKDPDNHSGELVWKTTAKTHKQYYDCCKEVTVEKEKHEWKDGVCSECEYVCKHKDKDKDHYCDICTMKTSEHEGGTATCIAKAECTYCGKEYGDFAAHKLTHINAKAATVAEVGNNEYWFCDVCNKYFGDANATNEIALSETEVAKLAPTIVAGNGQTVVVSGKTALTFTSNAPFEDFIRVELDGKTVDSSNYTVKSGSTIVTLNGDYVATLAAGEHTLGIVSKGGTATAKFTVTSNTTTTTATTVTAETTGTTTSAKTGDNSNLGLWITLLCVSGGAVTATTIVNRRKKCNR